MKAKLLVQMDAGPTCPDELTSIDTMPSGKQKRVCKPGTILEHLDAYKLVIGGFAEAADEECQKAVEAFKNRAPNSVGLLRKVHESVMDENEQANLERAEELEGEDEDE